MKIEDLTVMVAPEWRNAFVRFIETGEAEEAFLDHIDRDKPTQEAVELAFSAQSQALEGLAHALRESERPIRAANSAPTPAQTSDAIARALETAVHLPSQERTAVLETAVATVSRDMVRMGEAQELQNTLSDLKRALVVAEAAVIER